ncbi:hypothetical protein IKG49_01745 [Candidatus Saccharibacteria bacterium]|nr:hypothetical protein [Candidatus Saccharibacteria bacterium]
MGYLTFYDPNTADWHPETGTDSFTYDKVAREVAKSLKAGNPVDPETLSRVMQYKGYYDVNQLKNSF